LRVVEAPFPEGGPMADDNEAIEPIEPIEPYEDEEDTVDEPPVEKKRPGRGRTGRIERTGRGAGGTGRRARDDSIARISRNEPRGFFKRFLVSGLGALVIIGVQFALCKEFLTGTEIGPRGGMGYGVFAGMAAGFFIVMGIFCGIVAPRSLIRGFLLGAGLTAMAGLVLGVLPTGTLPVEAPDAEGAVPVRTLLAAVNPKLLSDISAIQTAEAKAKNATDAEETANETIKEKDTKIAELETAKKTAEDNVDALTKEVAAEKTKASSAEAKASAAEQKSRKAAGMLETQKEQLATAAEKVKAAEGEVATLKKQIADAKSAAGGGDGDAPAGAPSEEIEKLKLRLDLANGRVKDMQKKLAAAEAKAAAVPSGPSKPGWMTDEEYEKLKKLDARTQAKVKRYLK